MSTKYTLEQTIEIASTIPGWMTREEMIWLYRQVNILPQQVCHLLYLRMRYNRTHIRKEKHVRCNF